MSTPRILREIVVFLPNVGPEAPRPIESAHAFVDALGLEHAELGADVLTGGVEVRLLYDPGVVEAARAYLERSGLPFEIEVR